MYYRSGCKWAGQPSGFGHVLHEKQPSLIMTQWVGGVGMDIPVCVWAGPYFSQWPNHMGGIMGYDILIIPSQTLQQPPTLPLSDSTVTIKMPWGENYPHLWNSTAIASSTINTTTGCGDSHSGIARSPFHSPKSNSLEPCSISQEVTPDGCNFNPRFWSYNWTNRK
jgi:hypothetical protein